MPFSPDVYVRALEYAARAHGDQKTAAGLPYVVHLSSVAMELIRGIGAEPGIDADFAVTCALLHDILEDTRTPPSELRATFGPKVQAAVQALTKDTNLPKEERMEDSLKRILTQPREVAMVKLADRIANLAPPPAWWTSYKIGEYRKEAQRIYDVLHDASPVLARRFQERLSSYGAHRNPAGAPPAAGGPAKES